MKMICHLIPTSPRGWLVPSPRVILAACFLFALCHPVQGSVKITQDIALQEGWNAVWVEVISLNADGQPAAPAEVFAGHDDITTVATHFPEFGPMEFVQDPDEISFNEEQWAVWYREDPAGRSNLRSIHGNRAFLIQTSGSTTISLTGAVEFHQYAWAPNAYNLAGFGLLNSNPPTFAEFFAGRENSMDVSLLFKMENGDWVGVHPDDVMAPGQAYWIYVKGRGDFQGPFRIDFDELDTWDFGADLQDRELLLANDWTNTITLNIERFHESNGLELTHVVRDPFSFKEIEGAAIVDFSAPEEMAAGAVTVETLRIKREWSQSVGQDQLYRVRSDTTGSYHWLPVRADNPANAPTPGETPATTGRGLWVGDIVFNEVSRRISIESSDPLLEPTPALTRARVILHVDGEGAPSLVKATTLMRERMDETNDNGSLVLVVDPRKLPFFEGIQRHAGVLVGKRIETVFYDMPRIQRPSRPLTPNFEQSSLKEEYKLSLPLTGGVGPGLKCSTENGTVDPGAENGDDVLELDEWHRSNPFRHAFHPSHVAGYRIVREMEFHFDETDSRTAQGLHDYGRNVLTGIFTERIKGLVRSTEQIITQGRFVLRRLSDNPELN